MLVVIDVAARCNGFVPYELPPALQGLDTRFFRSDRSGRLQGGLFGLDGVHPPVSGYAVLTGAVLDVLAGAGVAPKNPPALMTTAFDLVTPFLNRLVSRRRA